MSRATTLSFGAASIWTDALTQGCHSSERRRRGLRLDEAHDSKNKGSYLINERLTEIRGNFDRTPPPCSCASKCLLALFCILST